MNSVNLIGRLTKDANLTVGESGVYKAAFTIAVNRPFAKEGQQSADFVNCVAFNKTAENLAQHCKKGSQIAVEGRVQTFNFDNEEGEKVFITNIVAEMITYLQHAGKETDQS